jgi:hypothetical protein
MLWRIQLANQSNSSDLEKLRVGLQRHLTFAQLSLILLKSGAQQQAYLDIAGCAKCKTGSCEPGCRVQLARRWLRASQLVDDLELIQHGLLARNYTQAVVAWPFGNQTQALDATFLEQWSEVRLVLGWQRGSAKVARASVLLLASAERSAVQLLRQLGWMAFALPSGISKLLANQPWPKAPPAVAPFTGPPFLPLPQAMLNAVVEPVCALALHKNSVVEPLMLSVSAEISQATAWITEVQRGPALPNTDIALTSVAALPNNNSAEFAALLEQLVASPALTSGKQRSQIGLTAGRLQRELGLNRSQAEALIDRLEAIAAIAPASQPERRFQEPRPLLIHDARLLVQQSTQHLTNAPVASVLIEENS